MTNIKSVSLILMIFFFASILFAQDEPPRLSPKAKTSQVIGYTEVTVIYSRPGVKERRVWGELVPYNEIWRTGANEATVIEFSDDVVVEGENVPKGKYALFTVPGEYEWEVILNKVWDQWGAFNHNPAENLVQFTIRPEESEFTERLQITFDYVSPYSAHLVLEWDKIEIPILIETR